MKKELVLKLLISGATVATLAALTAQMMYSSGPLTEKNLFLPLDEKVTIENLKPGTCVEGHFKGLDVSSIQKSETNWQNINFDFDDDNNVNARGCVALSTKIKKLENKEDGKARWEIALQKGNKGFVYLFSVWNENQQIKDGLVIALLEKENENWKIKKSMKYEDTSITKENKDLVFFTNGDGVVKAGFELDFDKLCAKEECKEGEYQLTNNLYIWEQSKDGENTFANWNTNQNSLINTLLKKKANNLPNLVKVYFGSEVIKNGGEPADPYQLHENKTIKGTWMKIS